MPLGLIVPRPSKRHVGQKVCLGAEVPAHPEGIGLLVVRIMHPEEICADAQIAMLGQAPDAPVCPARPVDPPIGLHLVTGNVLAPGSHIKTRLRVAPRILKIPLVRDYPAPYAAGEA